MIGGQLAKSVLKATDGTNDPRVMMRMLTPIVGLGKISTFLLAHNETELK